MLCSKGRKCVAEFEEECGMQLAFMALQGCSTEACPGLCVGPNTTIGLVEKGSVVRMLAAVRKCSTC